MDYSRLDPLRRAASPLQLDVVEAFVQGRLSRREFIRRATLLGLSAGAISTIVAACSTAATEAPTAAPTSGGATAAPTAAPSGGTIRAAMQRPVGLDPIAMQDLGSYGITAQSFEFLCALSAGGDDIAPGLATEWSPNADASVWTFKLRQGVKWQSGGDFTAEDVVASMERLVTAGNAGLKGVLEPGGTKALDPYTVEFSLAGPNGNFPYLVSVFNAQTLITPVDFVVGTTLDGRPDGTGAWKLESYDQGTGATFVRNPDWWGGTTPLDSVEWSFYDKVSDMVASYQGQVVDAIVQFSVLDGSALFDDASFNVIATRTATHRQIWMRVDKGTFKDKRVRQALALTFDRPAMVEKLFKGRADVGNDHVIAPIYPYYDDSIPQRVRDIEKAKALLADAGTPTPEAVLHIGEMQEIPELAVLIQSQAAEAGFKITIEKESLDTFYGAQWCPPADADWNPTDPPCVNASELGVVDYGHRATPDVYLNAALSTKGIWNSSQFFNADFDAAFKEFQASVGVDAQKAACKKIETVLNEEVPIGLPYFYNYLGGTSKEFEGTYSSALGQMTFSSTKKVG